MIDMTVMIAARNAAPTIKRAISSVMAAGDSPILLIDDYSNDDTVAHALEIAGARLKVIQPKQRKNIGTVRAAGVDAVQTSYAMWLDADDEILPGRIEAMLQPLQEAACDFSYGNCVLINGADDRFVNELTIPKFLKEKGRVCRQFERNWIPSIGWPAFKTAMAKKLNYNTDLFHGEDYDILLRVIMAGGKIGFTQNSSHKYYDYPKSLSRKLDNSRDYLPQILGLHAYDKVKKLLLCAEESPLDIKFYIASMAIFQQDYAFTLNILDFEIIDMNTKFEAYDMPYLSLQAFYRGVCYISLNETHMAIANFEMALKGMALKEAENNLAVALFKSGNKTRAFEILAAIQAENPSYYDARENYKSDNPSRITTHPARLQNSRDAYG